MKESGSRIADTDKEKFQTAWEDSGKSVVGRWAHTSVTNDFYELQTILRACGLVGEVSSGELLNGTVTNKLWVAFEADFD